jgi:hypothetical protein
VANHLPTVRLAQGILPASLFNPLGARPAPLEVLECANCSLSGPLPAAWDTPVLGVLDLKGNPQLQGGFKQVVTGSPALQKLVLAATGLQDALDETWPFDTRPLAAVDFTGAVNITGTLPSSAHRTWGPRANCLMGMVHAMLFWKPQRSKRYLPP